MSEVEFDLAKFERLQVEPAAFGHIDHLKAACAMLSKYDFVEACARYSATIKSMAESVSALNKFNATITIAFMSLLAERRTHSNDADWDAFIASNPDLLERDVLENWYSKDRLCSDIARTQFLLPDKVGRTHHDARAV
ncbi:MAG: hypothetical protein GY933_03730 [Hyphomicrobiales bacterium]|nr:hypothetical protein [Hyphomicrobiales bacterium]